MMQPLNATVVPAAIAVGVVWLLLIAVRFKKQRPLIELNTTAA
jgi:hypothetical protein